MYKIVVISKTENYQIQSENQMRRPVSHRKLVSVVWQSFALKLPQLSLNSAQPSAVCALVVATAKVSTVGCNVRQQLQQPVSTIGCNVRQSCNTQVSTQLNHRLFVRWYLQQPKQLKNRNHNVNALPVPIHINTKTYKANTSMLYQPYMQNLKLTTALSYSNKHTRLFQNMYKPQEDKTV